MVKTPGTFPKNLAQHTADLEMLNSLDSFKHVFTDLSSKEPKAIECIKVDGALDEGPGHEEVQYWWTLRHIQIKKFATFVTSRSSGSSYLNHIELQNGCLSRGHSNLFIPSTLGGLRNVDKETPFRIPQHNWFLFQETVLFTMKYQYPSIDAIIYYTVST